MNNKILIEAKEDIPLFFNDFKTFWDESLKNITDEHITEVYKGTLIFKNWKNSLHSIEIKNLDTLINELFEDINSSLYLAFLGQYRTSYMHMRSSIELAFQLLYFIHHPIEYSQWKNGAFIIKFNKLTEYLEKHPLLSQNNILTTLLAQISRKWTHCSKHIHGESPIFFQCIKDTRKTNSYSKKDYSIWKKDYIENIYLINKLYILFFKNDLNRFPNNSRELLISFLKQEDQKSLNL